MLQRVIFAMMMAGVLSTVLTAWVTWLAVGFDADFPRLWMRALSTSAPAAATISFIAGPWVLRVSGRLAQTLSHLRQA